MKHVILFFVLLLTTTVEAKVLTYRSTDFSYRYLSDYGYWTDWSPWEPSDCKIVIDLTDDLITIYSKSPQIYQVVEYLGSKQDNGGGKQAMWSVKDSQYRKATVRLRLEKTGNLQLYVDYSDMCWAYNIKEAW